jgi:Choline/Carnitine o-acyltransferase
MFRCFSSHANVVTVVLKRMRRLLTSDTCLFQNLSNVTEYGHLAANGKIDPLDLTETFWIRPQTTWLPKLPVPKLEETAIQYLEAVRVVADDDQYLRTKDLVQDFTQPDGLGPKLQQILLDKQQKDENWVTHSIRN